MPAWGSNHTEIPDRDSPRPRTCEPAVPVLACSPGWFGRANRPGDIPGKRCLRTGESLVDDDTACERPQCLDRRRSQTSRHCLDGFIDDPLTPIDHDCAVDRTTGRPPGTWSHCRGRSGADQVSKPGARPRVESIRVPNRSAGPRGLPPPPRRSRRAGPKPAVRPTGRETFPHLRSDPASRNSDSLTIAGRQRATPSSGRRPQGPGRGIGVRRAFSRFALEM